MIDSVCRSIWAMTLSCTARLDPTQSHLHRQATVDAVWARLRMVQRCRALLILYLRTPEPISPRPRRKPDTRALAPYYASRPLRLLSWTATASLHHSTVAHLRGPSSPKRNKANTCEPPNRVLPLKSVSYGAQSLTLAIAHMPQSVIQPPGWIDLTLVTPLARH